MDYSRALFIVVTISLIVLVVSTIVAVILTITLVKSIQRLVDKAEVVTDDLGGALRSMSKKLAPAVLSGIAAAGVRLWRNTKSKGWSDE